jgi:predicted site-specific integrase-resolvase
MHLSKLTYEVPEVMGILCCSRSTLWKWIKDGKIKKVPNLGVKVLITREELIRVLGITEQQAA